MIREAFRLIRQRSLDREHESSRRAFYVFASLWVLCVLASLVSHVLILSVQSLLVLHHCVSIGGTVAVRVLTSKAAAENRSMDYPFSFGLYRVRQVVCLAGAIFVAFGCLTTVVEGFHTAMHTHYVDPRLLLVTAVLHTVALLRYRREVLVVDRICGRPANTHGLSPDEEQLFRLSTTVPLRLVTGGANGIKGGSELGAVGRDGGTSPTSFFASGGFGKVSTLASLFSSVRLFLMPAACLTTCTFVYMLHNNIPDTVVTLVVALYYCSVAVEQGRRLVWTLVNNAVRDPIRLNALDRALRSVQLLDGVLQVHSSVFFMANPCEVVGMVRLRLMSGADAAAVTSSSRKLLSEVVRYSYVECFFPNASGGDDVLSSGFGPRFHFRVGIEGDNHHHEHAHACNNEHGHDHGHDHSRDHDAHQHAPTCDHGSETTPHEPSAHTGGNSPASVLPYPFTSASSPYAPTPLPLPGRPVWDHTPGSGPGVEGGLAIPAGQHRTPLVPLPAPRPVLLSAGSPNQLRPFPTPTLGSGIRGGAGGAVGGLAVPSGSGLDGFSNLTQRNPVAEAPLPPQPPGVGLPLPPPPSATRLSAPVLGAGAHASSTSALNVPPTSGTRPPHLFTPFTTGRGRTDKDV